MYLVKDYYWSSTVVIYVIRNIVDVMFNGTKKIQIISCTSLYNKPFKWYEISNKKLYDWNVKLS